MLCIDSPSNDKVKRAVRLLSSSRFRRAEHAFMLEGARLCADAVKSGLAVQQFFYTADALEKYRAECEALLNSSAQSFCISPAVEKRLSDTEHPQGIFCVCSIPDVHADIAPGGRFIALDCIQDPSNLGAICRTAEALGINAVILCGCCDIYNPKAQRAAMGSLLRLPLLVTDDLSATMLSCKGKGLRLYAAMPDERCLPVTKAQFASGAVVVIGNEGNGVSKDVADLCTGVTIPMRGRAESLNASMAAALIMWEMLRTEST